MADKKSGIRKFGEGATELGKAGASVAMSGVALVNSVGKTGGKATNGAFSLAGTLMSSVATFATKHKNLSLLAGVYVGVKGVQHVVKKHKEKQAVAAEAGASEAVFAAAPEGQYAGFRTIGNEPAMQGQEPSAAEMEALLQEALTQQEGAAQEQPQAEPKWVERVAQRNAGQQQGPSL